MEQLSTVFSRQESDLNGSKRLLTITLHKSSSSFSSCFPLSMQVKKAEPKVNVAKADLTWCDIYLYQFDIFITLKCWQSSAWGCQAPAPGKPRPQSILARQWMAVWPCCPGSKPPVCPGPRYPGQRQPPSPPFPPDRGRAETDNHHISIITVHCHWARETKQQSGILLDSCSVPSSP